jgi:hypothetical protein
MVVSDLSYIEAIPNSSGLQGGDNFAYGDYKSYTPNANFGYSVGGSIDTASITQNAYAAAGNNNGNGNISVGNVAIALNIAIVTQVNL